MAEVSQYRYILINNPVELRKNLLFSSKLIIQQMMSYEKIKMIREEKKKVIQELSALSIEMVEIYNKLMEVLPKPIVEEIEKEKTTEERTTRRAAKGKKSEKKQQVEEISNKKSKIEKLYEVLKQLDEKIEKLQ